MCGLVGLASVTPQRDRERLITMRDTMRHRGPDDEGVWWSEDGRIGLAHRRLSIIDLSPDARQPMLGPSGCTRVIFNGEIYNYQELRRELEAEGVAFRTASDTEVLLAAYETWGPDCLARLNGMFAFALHDARRNALLLARDRAGEKPLFYHFHDRRLAFASEIKALLAGNDLARRIDRGGLEHYLAFGYVPDGLCLLQGVRKLPQGHAALFDLGAGEFRTWAYWTLPAPDPDAQRVADPVSLQHELEKLLVDSVRLRLIADVPVGVMLSGGLDSSLVTAAAARVAGRRIKTFTISFPGHDAYDEGPFARQVASFFGTEHVDLAAEPATAELLPELARQYDEPIADSSMVPTYIISRLIRREATVALGGDGGDELFGGYPHYNWIQSQAGLRRRLPLPLRGAIGAIGRRLPLGVRGRNFVVGLGLEPQRSIAQFNLYFDEGARRRLLRSAAPPGVAPPEVFKANLCDGAGRSLLQQATAVDFQTYLVDDILVKVDRASMLASLEVRSPWLDPRIIDLAFRRVADELRATPKARKVLVRALAARLLPPSLALDRKQGFSLPLNAWFKSNWGAFMADVLHEADADLFDRRSIEQLLAAQKRGLGNTQRLFALTIFELWRREYRVSAG